MRRQSFPCAAVLAAVGLLLCTTPLFAKSLEPDPVPDAWLRAHADGSNSGFANVVTAPATQIARSTDNLGTIAYGAGPVVGQDGTVYIGNRQGTLFAFRADGSKAWTRQLPPGQEILASPAVGADGAIYVIGVAQFTDNRVNPPYTRPDSTLHKFLPGGGYAWNVPFPEPSAALPISNGRGGTTAPPNIWQSGGVEVVRVPVMYPNRAGVWPSLRLVAFSTDGPGVLADTLVTQFRGSDVTGSMCEDDAFLCFIQGMDFEGHGVAEPVNPADQLPADARIPFPGAAIYTSSAGGTPLIVVSDQSHDIVGFTFSPQGGFVEVGRGHDEESFLLASPLVLPDTKTFVGARRGTALFRGRDIAHRSLVPDLNGPQLARLVDGQTIIATGYGGFAEFRGNQVVHSQSVAGQTLVSAAASRGHFFISTASGFYTFDVATKAQLAKVDWRGGGTSPPAIGPRGDVYAIAGNKLHVFPRPCLNCAIEPLSASMPTEPDTQSAAPEPGQPTAPQPVPTPQGSNRFEKPTGPSGMRLYACTAIGGDECGSPVADAFCRAQGWAEADKFDVDSKKEPAETMAGEVCTKNKCKTFDYIKCEN